MNPTLIAVFLMGATFGVLLGMYVVVNAKPRRRKDDE